MTTGEAPGTTVAPDPLLLAKLDLLTAKVDKLDAKPESPKERSWITVAVQALALPALVATMYLQVSQGGESRSSSELSHAETAKVRTEELKTRAELQIVLDQLESKRAASVEAYEAQLEKSLPAIDATLQRLDSLNQAAQKRLTQDNVAKYLLVWVFLRALGIFFHTLNLFWGSSLAMLSTAIFHKGSDRYRRRRERRRKIFQYLLPVLSPLPSVLALAVDVTLFGAILLPLFDEVAAQMGSSVRFSPILRDLVAFRFGPAVDQIRGALFP